MKLNKRTVVVYDFVAYLCSLAALAGEAAVVVLVAKAIW